MAETTKQKDGGTAFPAVIHPSQAGAEEMNGMTLRDYFAGQALAGLLHRGGYSWQGAAEDAYAAADAMLAAREEAS